ncbi:hypothetical protein TRIP_E130006 [uncultured Spirochaetota bacterium]|jgi:hypothetical protein|uniref:Uncharacterized protein n=1 Tax=uncultured Spirochaetota bacterium TaxID=460511 RepID=A0A652ZSI7_9SPIR|nr:hypothetical protein TRIP_E130006 [uncultured Spirochaetota bacterium]
MTNIVIIGTVHKNTKKYTGDTLYQILVDIEPSCILEELSDEFYTESGELKKARNTESQEDYALNKYEKLKAIKIKPYDIYNRQEQIRNIQLFKNYKDLFTDINRLLKKKALSENETKIINDAYEAMKKRDRFIRQNQCRRINSIDLDKIIIDKNAKWDRVVKEVLPYNEILKKYSSFCKADNKFWDERTAAMVQNILNKSKNERTVVVLAGVEHRPELFMLLKLGEKKNDITIMEYWEYLGRERSLTNASTL